MRQRSLLAALYGRGSRRRKALGAGALFVATFLAACGPMNPERAADICEERARAAVNPIREVGVGVSSDRGAVVGGEIKITSDFLQGRDPQVVYEQCVRELTGQGPIRPLALYSMEDRRWFN